VRFKFGLHDMDFPLKHSYSILLLDFDGTLFSTLDSFVYSAKKALVSMGFSVDHVDLWSQLKKPFDRVVENIVGPLEPKVKQELVDKYVDVYYSEGYRYATPNSHAKEVLGQLTASGVRVAIVTSRTLLDGAIEKTLSAFSLQGYIHTIVTPKDVMRPKPYPDQHVLALRRLGGSPSHALAVGDSPEDIAASRSAGVAVAAYIGGFYTADQLVAHSPNYLIGDLNELLEFF
jgi:pyrophosphatase PpaX